MSDFKSTLLNLVTIGIGTFALGAMLYGANKKIKDSITYASAEVSKEEPKDEKEDIIDEETPTRQIDLQTEEDIEEHQRESEQDILGPLKESSQEITSSEKELSSTDNSQGENSDGTISDRENCAKDNKVLKSIVFSPRSLKDSCEEGIESKLLTIASKTTSGTSIKDTLSVDISTDDENSPVNLSPDRLAISRSVDEAFDVKQSMFGF